MSTIIIIFSFVCCTHTFKRPRTVLFSYELSDGDIWRQSESEMWEYQRKITRKGAFEILKKAVFSEHNQPWNPARKIR